ncbi:hypothetical protein CEP54_014092 [Fusarium duplospermum]|uniref:Uncharacterized protein n=1 Tax=Fusarium duplospermum TaxID=1325734 RepID=A0A428NYK7_9HYPO|nr:hypothetical protein CEP54_014092 [Fusarium duplospermum]
MSSKPDTIQYSLLQNIGSQFCRFLLDQGAETQVNVHSFRYNGIFKAETPLHVAIVAIPKIPDPWDEPLERTYDRISWLLEAGADVHIPDSSGMSCLDLAFSIADKRLKSIIIPRADIDVIGNILVSQAGGKPLLRQWLEHGPESTLANINLLVEAGANPKARNSLGQNCLHLVLESAAADSQLQSKELRRVLVQLIKNGADVDATNHDGNSVTDLAFHHLDPQSTLGTYPADLWACSLAACGYNVFVDFQNGQPRLPRFDSRYTSKDFETLWDGVKDRSYIFTTILHSPKETLNDSFSAVAQVFQPGDLASLLKTEPGLFEGMERYQWALDLQQAEVSSETIQKILREDGSPHQGPLLCTTPGDLRKNPKAQDMVHRRLNPEFHHASCCHHEILQERSSDPEVFSDRFGQPSQSSMIRFMEPLAQKLFGTVFTSVSDAPPCIYFSDESTSDPDTGSAGTGGAIPES